MSEATSTRTVYYYDCNCDTISKACEELHSRSVRVPLNYLRDPAEHDRQVAERAWDACVASMKYEDGSPVEIVASVNPYRAAKGEQK